MTKALSIAAGTILILASLIACGALVLAIFDPVGTKAADDTDPFGTPPSRIGSAVELCISAAIGAAGIYLILKPFDSRPDVGAAKR